MKQIYILLMHTHTRVSEFVRFMTRYPYSHVAISFDDGCDTLYSFGRRRVSSFLDGGFCVEQRDGEFFRVFPRADCIVYRAVVTDAQYAAARELVSGMERVQERYKYDFIGTGLRFLGFPVRFRDRYVCSYFVAYILEAAGIHHFARRVWLVNPRDFYALDGFEEIYRGKYLAWKGNRQPLPEPAFR